MKHLITLVLALYGITTWAQTSLPDLPTGAQRYSQTLWLVPSDSTLWTGSAGNYAQVATREQLRQLAAQGYTKSQVDSAITSQIGLIDFPVTSVAGKTGDVELDASDVGLGNVDNTSDADKPISTATQGALDGKENAFSKGSLVAGTGVTLDGTLANRLVGSGSVTINADIPEYVGGAGIDITGGTITNTFDYSDFGLGSSAILGGADIFEPISRPTTFIRSSAANSIYSDGGSGIHIRYNNNRASQIWFNHNGIVQYRHTPSNDVWGPIQTFWTSANYTPPVVFSRTVNGLVPSPGGSGTTRFLREDGSWTIPSGGGSGGDPTDLSIQNRTATTLQIGSSTGSNATVPQVTTSLAGLMNAADKIKLNGLTSYTAGSGISISGDEITNTWDFRDFALGTSATLINNTSLWNAISPTQFMRSSSADNNPFDWAGVALNMQYNSDHAAQLFISTGSSASGDLLQFRHTITPGTFGPVRTVWHNGNFTPSDYLLTSNFTWSNLSGKPSTFAPSPHSHSAADINSGTLAAARIPTLSISKISGLQSALDAKATSGTAGSQVRTNTQLDARYVQSIGAGSGISVSGTTVSLSNMSANTIKGRSGSTGAPQNLTPIQVRDIINPVTTNSTTTINMQNPIQRGSARSSNTTFSLSNSSAGRQVQFHMANSGSNAIQITITGATPHGNRIIPANQSAVISIIDFGNNVISYIVVPSI